MVCANCGFQNQEGATVCANCGNALSAPAPAPVNVPAASNPPPAAAPLAVTSYPPPGAAPVYAAPPKSRSSALILEILPGLFGFLGFGWMYVGETQRGVITLIGYIVFAIVSAITIAVTAGFGCLICVPLMWGGIAFSAYQLNTFLKAHPDRFSS